MKKISMYVLLIITTVISCMVILERRIGKILGQNSTDKFKNYYHMLNQWLMIRQNGVSLERYFEENGYQSIAIYGMGEMGRRLYEELKDTDVVIRYAVDKNAEMIDSDLKIISEKEEFEKVDAIIVTATFAFEEIEEEIAKMHMGEVLSLDDIVYELAMQVQ